MEIEKRDILKPLVHPTVFIAEGARIYGDVIIDRDSSIWFNAVIRGDEGRINIGRQVNVQDNVVIHSDLMEEVRIGDQVTIGHGSVLRSCHIGSNVMVGMNSTIMTHAEIGDNSIIGANTLVPYHKKFPPRSMIMGSPARLVRELTEEEVGMNVVSIKVYKDLVELYSSGRIIGQK